MPEFLDSGRKSWALDSRRWTLDAGRWTLDAGPWTLDPGRWTLAVGEQNSIELSLTVVEQGQNPVSDFA